MTRHQIQKDRDAVKTWEQQQAFEEALVAKARREWLRGLVEKYPNLAEASRATGRNRTAIARDLGIHGLKSRGGLKREARRMVSQMPAVVKHPTPVERMAKLARRESALMQ